MLPASTANSVSLIGGKIFAAGLIATWSRQCLLKALSACGADFSGLDIDEVLPWLTAFGDAV
jgi:hypothetical protein